MSNNWISVHSSKPSLVCWAKLVLQRPWVCLHPFVTWKQVLMLCYQSLETLLNCFHRCCHTIPFLFLSRCFGMWRAELVHFDLYGWNSALKLWWINKTYLWALVVYFPFGFSNSSNLQLCHWQSHECCVLLQLHLSHWFTSKPWFVPSWHRSFYLSHSQRVHLLCCSWPWLFTSLVRNLTNLISKQTF